ncbi:unnamed protein product [Rotaria magnacalcarata]|uniref:Uncharacterized protein n=1 Tax=Rotaria magnacalcarata TaxID=392030 RepID=A0A819GM60_9BILA|nr:unnamed protein product [Rotaria magnacalcarata]CAF3921342.1 unnamed protein product [Rotaria magnacalcarata]
MLPKRGRSRGGGGENCGRGELTDSSKLDQTPKNTEITYKQLEQQSIKLFTISPLILASTKINVKIYKQQQQQRIQQTIERYTTTISKPPPTAPNINDNEDFPSLTKTNLNYSSNMHIQIKDVLKEKMLEIIEQITQRI